MKISTKRITYTALLTALCFCFTTIHMPIGFGGYVNLGDCIIFFAALYFSPIEAMIVGGLGSMFADIALGYGSFAVATFIIKGLEGLICSLLYQYVFKKRQRYLVYETIAMTIAACEMVIGYYIFMAYIMGDAGALQAIVPNIGQGTANVILGVLLVLAVNKTKLFDKIDIK